MAPLFVNTTCKYRVVHHSRSSTTAVDGEQITDIAYSYDELGQLKTVKAGSDIETKYTYNIQGWLTRKSTNTNPLKPRLASINSGLIIDRDSLIMPPGGIAESLQKNIFEQTLEYFSPKYAQPRYAGNIAETSWKRGSNAEADTYAYTYDRLGRLVDGRFISGGLLLTKQYGERNIAYDKNTNILSLTRYNGSRIGTQYRYTYDGNRKLSVTSEISADITADYGYQYDIMGNISKIGAENLLISYNYLNLPKIITKTGTPRSSDGATYVVGVTRPTASYIYLADGTKVQAIGETGQGYEYVGSLRLSVNGSSVDIESIPFAGGRIVKTSNGYEPQYYITDHLGSTRTVVKPNATVVAEFDYMPYGTQHAVAGAPIAEADYKYTGKEQQTAFGLDNLYDSQARFQYVSDGSFMSHDPLSGTFPDTSPYMYCGGDPINRVDPDGRITRIYLRTNNLGHAFVTVGEGKNTVVYTYGRYGAVGSSSAITSGRYTPVGEGVLMRKKGNDAVEYLDEFLDYESIEIYEVPDVSEKAVAKFYDDLIYNSIHGPSDKKKDTYGDPNAYVIDDYNLLNNNCVTMTINSINVNETIIENQFYEIFTMYGESSIEYMINSPGELSSYLNSHTGLNPHTGHSIISISNPQEFIKNLIDELICK